MKFQGIPMADIIQILPDNVANQIAAGEVIQRPASLVKELMENSIDAGADKVDLIVKDAGRTLIQVIDNGCGMSETDARMSLEKHATSKIKAANDLFAIKTMGFRGEAMASIAAIARLEIKTKLHENELGTKLIVEGSRVMEQTPTSCPSGTNISVRNLFYNVPARRNFLKSDNVEMRHILQAFERIVLSYPKICFTLISNEKEIFNLQKGNFKQRIAGLYGKKYDERLVPVGEQSEIVSISGFVVKPQFSKKAKGEQFFFVNNRYIQSNYLNHAVKMAFSDLITDNSYPSFFLKLEIAPSKIDINIHPTKTEVKFEDEQAIYAILKTAVKQSLGKFNITPSLDFETEQSINIPYKAKEFVKAPEIRVDKSYNPFKNDSNASLRPKKSSILENTSWLDNLKEVKKEAENFNRESEMQTLNPEWEKDESTEKSFCVQIQNQYIFTAIKSGVVIIDQERAHERILFEQFLNQLENHKFSCQQLLFPETVQLSASNYAILQEIQQDVKDLGFDVAFTSGNKIVVNGVPFDKNDYNLQEVFDDFAEQYKLQSKVEASDRKEKLAGSLAKSLKIRRGKKLSDEEMQCLIDQLFACAMPYYLPGGKSIVVTLGVEELKKWFH